MGRRKAKRKLVEVCVPNVWAFMREHGMFNHDKIVWLYIVTGDHNEGLPGLFRLTESQIEASAGLRLTSEDSNADLDTTDIVRWAVEGWEKDGLLLVDRKAGVMMIRGAVGNRTPRDEDEARRWARLVFDLPECEVVDAWCDEFTKACEHCDELREAFQDEWTILCAD